MNGTMIAAVVSACALSALAEVSVVTADPLEWLYLDSKTSDVRVCTETDVPMNGVAEVNVLFNGLAADVPLSFSCTSPDAEWLWMVDVPVDHNTKADELEKGQKTNYYITRKAPYRVFDALAPLEKGVTFKPGSSTAALRLKLRKFAVDSGSVELKLRFEQGGFKKELPFKVNVHPVKVPPAGKDSFKYVNWMNEWSMAECHGIKPWSEEHWSMIARYLRLAVYGRQNMARLPLFLKNGLPDEAKYERFVKMVDEAGICYLAGPHLCRFSQGKWESPAFVPCGSTNITSSAAGAARLAELADAFAAMIERHGWKNRWYQHVADEPGPHNYGEYRITCAVVRKHMPGVKLFDAIELPEVGDALDAYCPKNYKYELQREEYEKLHSRPGAEMWCYTCCFPRGRWLNRLLDNEVIRPLLLPWGCHLEAIDGFLHWGFNQFDRKNDPLSQSFTVDEHIEEVLPPGDRNIAYAGKDGPWSSVRLEAMRQGFEDLELLRLLSASGRNTDSLVHRVMRGFGEYTLDVSVYRAARRDLLSAASAVPAVERAYSLLKDVFTSPEGLLYDYVGDLPSPEDCAKGLPNAIGWWSPIENGPMFTGPFLAAVCRRAGCTGSEADRAYARKLAAGLLRAASVSDVKGMVVRGFGADGRCHYPLGSDDQTLPWFFGLHSYWLSGIPDANEKSAIAAKLREVADALAANEWKLPCDGAFKGQNRGGFFRFERAFLPFRDAVFGLYILRVMQEVTGDAKWSGQYEAYLKRVHAKTKKSMPDVIRGGLKVDKADFPEADRNQLWLYTTAQDCLRHLASADPARREIFREGMRNSAFAARPRMKDVFKLAGFPKEKPFRYANWRTGYAWREQKTQKEAEAVAFSGNKAILGNRKGIERSFATTPLAAASICADAGLFTGEVNRTISAIDYDGINISEIYLALTAWYNER